MAQPKRDKKKEQKEQNAFLGIETLYIDHLFFFEKIQERGKPYTHPTTGERYSRKPTRKYHCTETDLLYGDIPILSNDLFDLYQDHPEVFPALKKDSIKTKNLVRERDKITKWILNDRQEMNRTDITSNSFPKLKENVDQIPIQDPDTVFALSQNALLLKAQIMWCADEDKPSKLPTMDTRARLFGLLFQEDFRDELNILVDSRSPSRAALDDPATSKKFIFDKLSLLMQNEEILIKHPKGWDAAVARRSSNLNIPFNEYWVNIDPNNLVDMDIYRSGKDIQQIYNHTKQFFNESMRKWISGTGGGSGDPENYYDFDNREAENFSRYDPQFGVLLTYIFMYDKNLGHPLKSSTEPLPGGGIEVGKTGTHSTVSSINSIISPTKKNPKNDFNVLTENMNKIMTENVKSMGIMLTAVMNSTNNNKCKEISTANEANNTSNVAANTTEIFDAIDKCEIRKRKILDVIEKSSNSDEIKQNKIYVSICDKRIKTLYNSLN